MPAVWFCQAICKFDFLRTCRTVVWMSCFKHVRRRTKTQAETVHDQKEVFCSRKHMNQPCIKKVGFFDFFFTIRQIKSSSRRKMYHDSMLPLNYCALKKSICITPRSIYIIPCINYLLKSNHGTVWRNPIAFIPAHFLLWGVQRVCMYVHACVCM